MEREMAVTKHKRTKVLWIVAVILFLLAIGITLVVVGVYNQTIEVVPVSTIQTQWWGDDRRTYGTVTNDFSQTITLDSEERVEEVFVQSGQQVKAGDPLLAYDVSLLDLQLSAKEYSLLAMETGLLIERELLSIMRTNPATTQTMGSVTTAVGKSLSLLSGWFTVPVFAADTPDLEKAIGPDIALQGSIAISQGDGTVQNPYLYLSESLSVDTAFLQAWAAVAKTAGTDTYVKIGQYHKGDAEKQVVYALHLVFAADGGLSFDFEEVVKPQPPTSTTTSETSSTTTSETSSTTTSETSSTTTSETSSTTTSETSSTTTSDTSSTTSDEPIPPPEPEPLPPAPTYTPQEIYTQEQKIEGMSLDVRLLDLEIRRMRQRYEDNVAYSTVDGVVQGVQDIEQLDPTAPILTVLGSDAYYIKAAVSEHWLDQIAIGQTVQVTTYESAVSVEGTLVSISYYPIEKTDAFSQTSNASEYPVVISIPSNQPVKEHESAEVSFGNQGIETGSLYIMAAYTRTENGQTYAMVEREGRLEKQILTVGKMLYGEHVEVLSGLSPDDYLAFPYGTRVQEGLRVVRTEGVGY